MIFIDCGDGNSDDYDSKFVKELKVMLDELSEEDTHAETESVKVEV